MGKKFKDLNNNKNNENIEEELKEDDKCTQQEENNEKCNNECCKEENRKEEENLEDVLQQLKGSNAVLADENEKLENQLTALKDRFERIVSEYDNYRKRTAKEKEGIYVDACGDVLKELLPVLDNLERAVQVDGNIEDIKKGIEITVNQFKDSLCKLEVEQISTEEGFDPTYHNAMMHVQDEQYGKNEIVEVFQKGYKKGDKVLRYSMVKVAN